MNRTYRHVWSKAQNRCVVAAETAGSRGGAPSSATGIVLAVALLGAASGASAQIAPVGGNTEVFRAPNGVQVVNINTANNAGLSHNRYTNYNVETTGVVLNNANSAQMTRNSVLAGQLTANLNLAAEARVILNEVVANNRSVLRGFTEVMGGKADVVLANPYGITCNGCGYINVDRALMTTGVPQVGANGALDAFRVTQGDILITGTGLDATGPRLLDLVARSVKLDGRVAATDVGITTGANQWTWSNRNATPIAGTGDTPLFAFDSTALGGMYANRIRIVATEAGVGVRMLGEVAASGDDFSLDAAGRIAIHSRVSAERDLALRQTVQAGAEALTVSGTEASLGAGRDLLLASAAGGVTLGDAMLTADRDLTLQAQSLADTTASTGGEVGSRAAGRALHATLAGNAALANTRWTAGGDLTVDAAAVQADTVTLGAGSDTGAADRSLSITARTGDIDMAGGSVASATQVSLDAQHGAIAVDAAQSVTAGTDLRLQAASMLANAGTLGAQRDIVVRANHAAQTLAVVNSGRIEADHDLDIAGTAGARNLTLNQQAGGLLAAAGTLAVSGTQVDNAGTAQAGAALSLGLDGALNNAAGGELLAGDHGTLTVSANTLANSGTVQSKGSLAATVASQLTQTATGRLVTVGDAAGALALNVPAIQNAGLVSSAGNATLRTASLDNSGRVQAAAALAIGESAQRAAVQNRSGGALIGDTFSLQATSVNNAGGARMQWSGDGTVNAQSLTNAASTAVILGSIDGDATSTINVSGVLSNAGAIHSGGDAVITAGALANTNTAGISALRDVSATVTQSANGGSQALRNEGAFYAGRNLSLRAASGTAINAGTTGTLDAAGDLTVNARDVINQNSIRANNITLTGTNSVLNQPPGGLPTIYLDEAPVATTGERNIYSASYNCNIFGAACNGHDVYERTVTLRERLSGALPATKAQVLAANTLNINYGAGGAANQAGILSARTINIAGSGSFVNQDFHLDEMVYAYRRTQVEVDCSFCSADYTNYYPANELQFNNRPGDDGDNVRWNAGGVWSGGPTTYRQERTRTTYYTSGAGIFAVNINFSGGALVNRGSPQQATPTAPGSSNAPVVGRQTVTPSAGVTLGGVTITLPTNPNGYFVPAKDPNAGYLVETNPLFQVGTDFVGSDYMAKRLGGNPDTTITRLGDASYEAQLVRQQLIAQTGRNLLVQAESEAQQMKRLMDNAVASSNSLGLTYGKAPTPEQLSKLTGDIVWMVETVVNGKKVVAPVVYLSQDTRLALEGNSTTIAATNANIDAKSLENTGGTIAATGTLNVKTQGDITNTSGTIKGGDVKLKSTEGSIVNKTLATTAGDGLTARTNIGKTGGIEATGSLALDAKKDIQVIGADVSAGKDATLAAGGNVTFDTIVDKSADSVGSKNQNLLGSSASTTSVQTTKNIGSNLNVGNNLNIKSGGDTTIAGSTVKAGNDLNVDAGGSFNVLARQDTRTVSTESSRSGLGVGGGLTGSEKTTTENFTGTNAGSTIQAGGNANLKAGKEVVVQASDVKVAGNADIDAKDGIKILDGLDEQRTTSRTETTTYLKIGSSAAAEAGAEAKNGAGRSAEASASAEAGAEYKLAEKSVTQSTSGSRTSVASNLQVGGNLGMKTQGTLTVQGSNVEAGGNLSADAKNIEMLTGRNETYATSNTESKSIGIYDEASAEASANASQTGGHASAGASASASATRTIGARKESASSSDYALTNSASTLKSGGSMDLKAKEQAKFVGADVQAGGDLNIQAKDITSLAAQDITASSSSSSQQTAGLYIGASASADASGSNAGGQASASAEVSAGLRYADKNEGERSGSVTQVTSSFKSGGNVTRKAEGTITDQGTQIEAAGDIRQSARVIKEIAAENSTYESSNASSNDARLGVYAGAGAGANSSTGTAGADASAGLKASYEGSKESSASSSTTAVTSRYKAGGSIDSTSTEKTTLIGTQFEAGKDVNLTAGSLDYQAARDTTSSSSNSLSGSVEGKVGLIGTVGGSVSGELEAGKSSGSSSTARTGSINAGGGINVKTGGDASFEGTQFKAGDAVNVDAGGNVDFKAARDTSKSSDANVAVSASIGTSGSGSDKSKEAGIGGSVGVSGSSSDTARTSSIEAGNGGVTIKSGNNTRLEGTQVKTSGDATVQAGGKVEAVAAKSSASSYGVEASASIGGSSEGGKGKSGGGFGIGAEGSSSSSSQGVSIQSGGKKTVESNVKPAATAKPATAKTSATKKGATTSAKAGTVVSGTPTVSAKP